jgi:DNA-binding CsgD family transcriptional regulator
VQSAAYCEHASTLFRSLDDRQGLASSLALLSFCGNSCYVDTDTLVPAAMSEAESITYGEQAVQIAREIGWRAGESLTLSLAGHSPTVQGRYGEALAMIQCALGIAQEIEHQQWICLAHRYLGGLYLDLLALPLAQHHLEQALTLANKIGSLFHAGMARGHLISIYILQNELASAETFLNTMLRPDLPMQTLTQRLAWQGRAELALAQGDPGLALQITDRLISSATNIENRDVGAIPYLAQLRGEALTALQRWTEAETALLAALMAAHTQGALRLVWRIHVALGKFYQAQARRAEARQAFTAAHTIIEELAANVPDSHLHDNFVRQATALIPPPKPASPLQAAKQAYGGLTRREREVAALVAEGKSNRTIAETLVLGERTVEGHVGNILAKLGFTSRAQIAVWAVEKGLMKDP